MHSERPVTWLGVLQKSESPPDAWKAALNRLAMNLHQVHPEAVLPVVNKFKERFFGNPNTL
jgi:hypothetical protein